MVLDLVNVCEMLSLEQQMFPFSRQATFVSVPNTNRGIPRGRVELQFVTELKWQED